MSHTEQGATDDQMLFAQRTLEAARECKNVLKSIQIIIFFVPDLTESTRERTLEAMRHNIFLERRSSIMVRAMKFSE